MCRRSSRAAARSRRSAVAALLALALPAGCGGDGSAPLSRDGVIARDLRDGGLVLVMRHARTEQTTDEVEVLGDCSRQRNLSEEGRRQAAAVGEAVRGAGIPVGEVRASPMCRTRETAELAFPGEVEIDRTLVSPGVVGTLEDDERRIGALKALASAPPEEGNLLLVTHTGNIGGAFGTATVQEGDVLVVRPAPGGGEPLRVVAPEDWRELGG
jgi:phosphohistidine phosphatase SixA